MHLGPGWLWAVAGRWWGGRKPIPSSPHTSMGCAGAGRAEQSRAGSCQLPAPCHQSRDTPGRIQCPQSPVLLQGTPEMQETKEHFQCSRVSVPSRLLSTAAVLTSLPAPGTSGSPEPPAS